MPSESYILRNWNISDCATLAQMLYEARLEVLTEADHGNIASIRYVGMTPRSVTKARLLKLERPEGKPSYELELE